jgi:glucosamine--fructose-6-phosphate aminotransferase (isomerizing)
VKAGDYLASKDIPFVGVTCTADETLQQLAAAILRPSTADEKSTVMTLSFTSMLIAIQYLAARLAGNTQFLDSLRRIPEASQSVVDYSRAATRSFVDSHEFTDYVWLGQGPCYGLACEGALKINEMSLSYTQSFHTLEFRHGPKSIVSPETLIMFQLSEEGYEQERAVLEEVKELGGKTLVVANHADERVRRAADLVLELNWKGHEYAGLAPRMVPGQLLGLYTGLKKRLDPDNPHNLSRVVILKDND